jgi:hypothetical protein
MIVSQVLELKNDVELKYNLKFKKGAEFTIVRDVVYMGGFMLPPDMQGYIYGWITQNLNLFKDVTRQW